MSKDMRYSLNHSLTRVEMVRLQELSKKLKLNKGQTIGLLIMKARLIKDDAGEAQLVDESLIIQEDQSDVN